MTSCSATRSQATPPSTSCNLHMHPCSEGCSHALDVVETGWSLDQELEEAPVHLHEQESITALLPAIDKAFPSTAPDATMDATPHPHFKLAFHALEHSRTLKLRGGTAHETHDTI